MSEAAKMGFFVVPFHFSSWRSLIDANSTVVNRFKKCAMSFLFLLLLHGNSILSLSSWRVLAACFCTPNSDPLALCGSNDGGSGGTTGFISLLVSVYASWVGFFPCDSCGSSITPAVGTHISAKGPLFYAPCSMVPFLVLSSPLSAVIAVNSPPYCWWFYVACT